MALNQIVVTLVANAQQFIGQLRGAAQATAQVTKQMADHFNNVGSTSSKAAKEVEGFSTKMSKFLKDSLGDLARFTGYYLAVGNLTKFLGGAVQELRELDTNLRNIQSITLESDARIKELSKDLIGMVLSGQSAGKSASELAAAMYELTSAGYSSSDALALAKVSAEGASAGLTTTDKASKALLTILQAYKLPVSAASEVMNQLFVIVDKGVLHFDDLVTNLGYVIPAAAALHVPLNELGAAIELLTRQGQQPSRVMTNLNDVLTKMLKPNKDLAKAIAALGFSSGAAMIKQLGLAKSIELISNLAESGGVKTQANSKKIEEMGDKYQESKQKIDDHAEAVRQSQQAIDDSNEAVKRAKFTMQQADAALAHALPGAKNHAQLVENARRAHVGYDKAVREASDALRKQDRAVRELGDANKAANKTQQDFKDKLKGTGDELEDSDSLLAKWFGDVRAIRAILPLAANSGRDFNAMLKEHNLEALSGDRHLKALAEQSKSFDYQLKALTSNLKAVAAVLGGPVLRLLAGMLRHINNLFKSLVSFNTETHHFTTILDKYPQIVDYVTTAIQALALVIVIKLIPAILQVMRIFGTFQPLLSVAKFLGPWAILALVIFGILKYFGLWDEFWLNIKLHVQLALALIKGYLKDFLKFFQLGFLGGMSQSVKTTGFQDFAIKVGETVRAVIDFLKQAAKEFKHFFTLGFLGGDAGGKLSPIAEFALNVGKDTKKVITFLKEMADAAQEAGRLFLLGFQGGSVGGNVSGLVKFFVDAGAAAHDFIDFLINEAVPTVVRFYEEFYAAFFKRLIEDFNGLKDMIIAFVESDVAAELWASFKEGLQVWRDLLAASKPFFEFIIDNADSIGQFVARFWEIAAVVGALALLFLALTTPVGAAIAIFIALTLAMGYVSRHMDEIKAKFEELKAKVTEFWNGLPLIIRALVPILVAAIMFLFEQMKDNMRIAFQFIKETIENFAQIISGVWNIIAGIWQGDFGRIWKGVKEIFSGFWAEAVLIVRSGLDLVTSTISNALPFFVAAVGALPNLIIGALQASIPAWVKAGIDLGVGIGEAIVDGVKRGLKNLAKIKIRIPALRIAGHEITPEKTLSLELIGLARGVRDFMGGLAMVGENGPEAVFLPRGASVLPADRTSRMMDGMERSSGGGGVSLHYAPQISAMDADQLIAILKDNADQVGAQMRLGALRRGSLLTARL